MSRLQSLKRGLKGMLVAVAIGVNAVLLERVVGIHLLDPLLVALVLGTLARSWADFDEDFIYGFKLAPSIFIPIGVIFYGAVNLDFIRFASVDKKFICIVLLVFVVYMVVTLLLSRLLGLGKKIRYLIATGSVICGASAIAITSRPIDAEPDEVSVSLVPVFISALVGFFVILPVVGSICNLSNLDYGVLSGTVLQFTGFVKEAVRKLPTEIQNIALSVKAIRYVGLLIVIPLFASFVKGRFFIPWYLWAFLASGLLFSFLPQASKFLAPFFGTTLTFLWSIAMGAIGLNADVKVLFTTRGLKALAVSLASFMIAVGAFLVGYVVCGV